MSDIADDKSTLDLAREVCELGRFSWGMVVELLVGYQGTRHCDRELSALRGYGDSEPRTMSSQVEGYHLTNLSSPFVYLACERGCVVVVTATLGPAA